MKSWIMVLKAADAAARWHVHQRRKGAAKEHYINHLLEVATLVAEAIEDGAEGRAETGQPGQRQEVEEPERQQCQTAHHDGCGSAPAGAL